jgi:glucans biosynthesis protein
VSGPHQRNFGPMMHSTRCGAKTRAGTPCLAPATRGRARCRMHGGAAGSGAPKGNRNALKHGVYTSEAIDWRKHINQLMRSSRALNAEI